MITLLISVPFQEATPLLIVVRLTFGGITAQANAGRKPMSVQRVRGKRPIVCPSTLIPSLSSLVSMARRPRLGSARDVMRTLQRCTSSSVPLSSKVIPDSKGHQVAAGQDASHAVGSVVFRRETIGAGKHGSPGLPAVPSAQHL